MIRTTLNRALGLALLVSAAAGADTPSAGDLETARALYKEGLELRAKNELDLALERFRAAHALGRTPVTGVELARTYAQMGLIVEALESATDVARIPVANDETEKSANARREAATMAGDLRPRVPTLLARVTAKSRGRLIVKIDDRRLPEAAIGQPYRVNPGSHTVTAQIEGGDVVRASVVLAEREAKSVDLAPPEPRAPEPIAAPDKPSRARPSLAPAIVSLSLGGVGLIVGAASGVAAIQNKDALARQCAPMGSRFLCPRDQWATIDEANLMGTVATVALIAGGALTVFGFGWLLLTSSASSNEEKRAWIKPEIGPGWIGAHARF